MGLAETTHTNQVEPMVHDYIVVTKAMVALVIVVIV
jgi:hypothetical protein